MRREKKEKNLSVSKKTRFLESRAINSYIFREQRKKVCGVESKAFQGSDMVKKKGKT